MVKFATVVFSFLFNIFNKIKVFLLKKVFDLFDKFTSNKSQVFVKTIHNIREWLNFKIIARDTSEVKEFESFFFNVSSNKESIIAF
jgi:hypothetical protein